MPTLLKLTALIAVSAGLASHSFADVISVFASDSGFVTVAGGSSKGDGTIVPMATNNYSVGRELHYGAGFLFSPLVPMDRKNYFVFDLTAVSGTIVGAKMTMFAGPDIGPPFPGGSHGYESLDPFEIYEVSGTSDFAGSLADIVALKTGNTMGPSGFDDPGDPLIGTAAALYTKLAVGPLMATYTLTPADDGTIIEMIFTPAGLAYLNSTVGGMTILGGKLPTAIPPATPQSVFGFTGPTLPGAGPGIPKLELLTIPEPGFGCGLEIFVLLAAGRTNRKRFSAGSVWPIRIPKLAAGGIVSEGSN